MTKPLEHFQLTKLSLKYTMATSKTFNDRIAFMCNSAGIAQTETIQLLHRLNQPDIDVTEPFSRDKRWKESQSVVPPSKIETINEQQIALFGFDVKKPNFEHFLNVNGILHVIGGEINIQHLIWDETKKDLRHNYTFAKNEVLSGQSLIYAPSKGLILVIGGKTYDECEGEFFMFGIWMHDLRRNKWKELKFTLPFDRMKTAITSDEGYIILSGGYNINNERSETMYVLDIRRENDYKLKKSTIQNPIPNTSYNFVVMKEVEDEKLIMGWIRESFQSLGLQSVPFPKDLLPIICESCSTEKIHWMQTSPNSNLMSDQHKHFTIEIDELLADIDNEEEQSINIHAY